MDLVEDTDALVLLAADVEGIDDVPLDDDEAELEAELDPEELPVCEPDAVEPDEVPDEVLDEADEVPEV